MLLPRRNIHRVSHWDSTRHALKWQCGGGYQLRCSCDSESRSIIDVNSSVLLIIPNCRGECSLKEFPAEMIMDGHVVLWRRNELHHRQYIPALQYQHVSSMLPAGHIQHFPACPHY